MLLEDTAPRVVFYFCRQCEVSQVSAMGYEPAKCTSCDSVDFWSEFHPEAPCNRQGEEENEHN